jgi:hypothetical protein
LKSVLSLSRKSLQKAAIKCNHPHAYITTWKLWTFNLHNNSFEKLITALGLQAPLTKASPTTSVIKGLLY